MSHTKHFLAGAVAVLGVISLCLLGGLLISTRAAAARLSAEEADGMLRFLGELEAAASAEGTERLVASGRLRLALSLLPENSVNHPSWNLLLTKVEQDDPQGVLLLRQASGDAASALSRGESPREAVRACNRVVQSARPSELQSVPHDEEKSLLPDRSAFSESKRERTLKRFFGTSAGFREAAGQSARLYYCDNAFLFTCGEGEIVLMAASIRKGHRSSNESPFQICKLGDESAWNLCGSFSSDRLTVSFYKTSSGRFLTTVSGPQKKLYVLVLRQSAG